MKYLRVSFVLQLVLQCRMILNGVCVIWNGHIDMDSLDGVGRIEFDTASAEVTKRVRMTFRKQNFTL